ncbi:MAG: glyoxalase [Phormidesmis sp.]
MENNTVMSEHQVFVAIASLQIAKLVTFYSDFFSSISDLNGSKTTILPVVSSSGYAEFHLAGLKLALFEPSANHVTEFSATSGPAMSDTAISLCIEVSDLKGAIAHLTAMGYPPPGEIIHAAHGQEIYAYDPDGNRLILHQAIATSD